MYNKVPDNQHNQHLPKLCSNVFYNCVAIDLILSRLGSNTDRIWKYLKQRK